MDKFWACVMLGAVMCATACSGTDGKNDDGTTATLNVLVATPQSLDNGVTRKYAGRVKEGRSISLGFKTAGQLERIYVKEGDHVREGQLIAELDTADYALAVRQLQIQYDQAAAQYERQKYLYEQGNTSENDFGMQTAQFRQLGVQLQLNRNKLDYTRLYSPVSGIVTALNHEKAEMVDAGTPLIELMDAGGMEVVVDLPLADYTNRNRFATFEAVSPRGGEPVPLTLLSVTPKADSNQLFKMKLGVPASARNLFTSGMNVDVTVTETDSAAEGVTVPLRSVFRKGDDACVWVVMPDSTVEARVVGMGQPEGDRVVITAGLDGDETIVSAGVNALRSGCKVKVIEQFNDSNVGRLL